MTNQEELKKIKKTYGERFMHLCRELFPTILEEEGKLYEILSLTFGKNCKNLYEDITSAGLEDELKSLIYSKLYEKSNEENLEEEKTPYELLEEAGYVLTECETEEEIQSFKKYYAKNEELCTFRGGRLNRCVVFFAVKKDVEDIRREDFKEPKREDEYGTSVMGIQFYKTGMCTVSIKNRYNHRVKNPDATYGNDLERIIPGLTKSFERLLAERGLKLNSENKEELSIPGYVKANDGKYYKYNMEVNGIYYCPGNIIIEYGEVRELANSEILLDYFILDIEYKELFVYDSSLRDSFTDALKDIQRIEVQRNAEDRNRTRTITISIKGQSEPVVIEIDSDNQIVGYTNHDLTEVENSFLAHNRALTKLEMPALVKVGDSFLHLNKSLTELEMRELTEVGNIFLSDNTCLTELQMPKLVKAGNSFLRRNEGLTELEMPELTEVGMYFLSSNRQLTKLRMPVLVKTGRNFLYSNEDLTKLQMPVLVEAGRDFLYSNKELIKLQMPKLVKAGSSFLYCNEGLTELDMPKLAEVGKNFLYSNTGLRELRLQELTNKIGENFLMSNRELSYIEIPDDPEVRERLLTVNKNGEFQRLVNGSKKSITPKDIAELDKKSELTETEIGLGRRIINKLKELFRKSDNQR